jgi:putative ABC transport system ATP-binding protein
MPILELRNVSKWYETTGEPFYAVRDVSLTVEAGEFVAITGPSGSGKSTMMHLMGLLDTPSAGEVWIDGVATSRLSDAELARLRNQKIGFVFQHFNLLPRTTAWENVALPLMYAGVRTAEQRARARMALQRVGLDPDAKGHNHPNQLSGGQQQRVAIARALVTGPDLVLADEPTGNLDSKSTDEILALFQSLNDDGTTIVLVTHEPYVAQHARRIIRFSDGRIVGEERVEEPLRAGPPAELEVAP